MENEFVALRIDPLDRLIAYKFWELSANDDSRSGLTAKDIQSLFTVPVSSRLIESALDPLVRSGRFYRGRAGLGSASGPPRYKLLAPGILLVEDALRQRESDLSYFRRYGDTVVEELAGIDSDWMTDEQGTLLDSWEPLKIDRQSPEYETAVARVEEVIETVRSSNGFAAGRPEERTGILVALSEGLQWLKTSAPTRAQISNVLLSPLRFLATQFARAAMGDIAIRAIEALRQLIQSAM